MTDLAFIVNTSDAALPVGRVAASVSDDSSGSKSFSSLLGERLQSGLARRSQTSDSSSSAVASDVNTMPESGVAEPVDGKPLPLSSAQEEIPLQDSPQEGLANAALLAAITQSAPRDLTGTTVIETSATEVESGNLLPGGLLNTLGEAVPGARAETQAALPKTAALPDAQLTAASLAKQLTSVKTDGLSAEKQDPRSDNSRVPVTSITPSLLAQPISESAQRALVMAMKDAGLGKHVAPSIAGQSEASQTLSARQTGLSPLSNGLMTAMQLAAVTGKPGAGSGVEAGVLDARLTQLSSPALTAAAPLTSSANDISGLLSTGPSLSTTAGTGFMPTMSVATPVGQAGWANELGQRVAWLAQGELREAQLQLHPRNLGPVEVRIAYGHEQQLNVSFTAANPLAREALDAALPRLREMFEQQGLNLADANISQHSFSEQRNQESDDGKSNSNLGSWSSETEELEELTEQAMLSHRLLMGDGMLDAYA